MTDHVEVTGTGAASAVPDIVVLDTRVQWEAADVASALTEVSERVRAALRAADERGVGAADRRTTGMGVSQRWDRGGREVVGYTAFQAVRLTVRERERVGEVLGALADAAGDAFTLDAVALELADPAPVLEQARTAAFDDARARAAQYAALAGRPLGAVLRVREDHDRALPVARFAMAAASVGGTMPVEAGESTVTASVTVRFGLG